jgi:uncharacterized protein YggE
MRKSAAIFLPLLFCPAAFAQLDSNSITVSASNNTNLQPDQALFSVSVQSGIDTGLDDVLTALQGSGITAANLSGVNTQGQAIAIATIGTLPPTLTPTLTWSFTLPAPLANIKATVASLTTVQQNIAKLNNGFMMSFNIVGTQVSQQLVQSQTCSLPSLITAATTQAQNLAAASGLTLGAILALSSSTSNSVFTSTNVVSGPGYVSTTPGSAVPAPCAITVKFNVTRN